LENIPIFLTITKKQRNRDNQIEKTIPEPIFNAHYLLYSHLLQRNHSGTPPLTEHPDIAETAIK
jgi:hypothetical protein